MMKTIAGTFLVLSNFLVAFAGGKSARVTVENPANCERANETIALPLADLKAKVNIDPSRLVVVERNSDKALLSQVTGEELLFQSDFKANEKREFIVKQSDAKMASPQSLVDGRFELPREDYAWENDKIAFRMYGPALAKEVNNGIDVWCKRVKYLIVDKWYSASAVAGKDTYHEDHGEGADFFSVGKSLGAGGSGIWMDGKLFQPGVFSSQKTLCNGPIRVTFELTYANWDLNGRKFTERKRISLDAGQNLNKIEVTFEGLGAGDSLRIACGLVKRANTSITTEARNCVMGLWGLTTADSTNGFLGTGVVVSPSTFLQFAEDKDQYFVIGLGKGDSRFTYYSGACWTKGGDFSTVTDWTSYLTRHAQAMEFPLRVRIASE